MTYTEDRELLDVLRELMRDVAEHRYVKHINVERNEKGQITKVELEMRENEKPKTDGPACGWDNSKYFKAMR